MSVKLKTLHPNQSEMLLWGFGELVREEMLLFQSSVNREDWLEAMSSLDRARNIVGAARRTAQNVIVRQA